MKHYLQQELEDRLRADLDLFKFIESHSLDGLWYWDLEDQDHEYINHRFWEVLGYDPSTKEHSPKEWFEIIDPEGLELAQENLDKHFADPSHPYDQVVRYKHADGSDVWVRCRGIAIRDENGKPIRMLGCHNDVTELKRREKEAHELLKSYRALIETNSIFYIKTDIEGNYTYANNCFLDRFGYKFDSLIGTASLMTICKEDHGKTFETVAKCFEVPNVPHWVVLRKPYGDGRVRSNHWEFYGMTNGQGEVVEIICVGVEITDLIDRTQELQRLLDLQADKNQRLQQHSYITSHNIRNSVANIQGLLEMMKEDPEKRDTYFDLMEKSVNALDETIVNLSKLLSEEKESEYSLLKTINVKEHLQRILDMEASIIRSKQVDVEVTVDESLEIETHSAFFDSVFHNLISNALKYGMTGKEKDRLIIRGGFDGPELIIEVKDFGLGFDLPNNAELLFRMGTRLSNETMGQGLGLFITKHHARMMGATILVDSAPGKGASFKVIWNGQN